MTRAADLQEYEGPHRRGQRHGSGRLNVSDGSVYVGEFVSGKRCGLGTLLQKDGYYFSGHWNDDMKFGEGSETLPDGETFKGHFFNDLRHGAGTLFLSDGTLREGFWWEDKSLSQKDFLIRLYDSWKKRPTTITERKLRLPEMTNMSFGRQTLSDDLPLTEPGGRMKKKGMKPNSEDDGDTETSSIETDTDIWCESSLSDSSTETRSLAPRDEIIASEIKVDKEVEIVIADALRTADAVIGMMKREDRGKSAKSSEVNELKITAKTAQNIARMERAKVGVRREVAEALKYATVILGRQKKAPMEERRGEAATFQIEFTNQIKGDNGDRLRKKSITATGTKRTKNSAIRKGKDKKRSIKLDSQKKRPGEIKLDIGVGHLKIDDKKKATEFFGEKRQRGKYVIKGHIIKQWLGWKVRRKILKAIHIATAVRFAGSAEINTTVVNRELNFEEERTNEEQEIPTLRENACVLVENITAEKTENQIKSGRARGEKREKGRNNNSTAAFKAEVFEKKIL